MTAARRRSRRFDFEAFGLVVVVAAATGLTWRHADAAASAADPAPAHRVAASATTSPAAPSSARRDELIEAGLQWLDVESAAYDDLAHGRWFSALDRIDDPAMERCLRLARLTRVRELEDAILACAANEAPGDDGLRRVFVVAAGLRDGVDVDDQDRGRRAIAWASAKALVPYGRDRRDFTRAYRAVRFGDGRLDAPGGSPVRRFQFDEAAARLAAARRDMTTWCYERRVLSKCDEYRRLAKDWTRFVDEFLDRVDVSGGERVEGLLDAKPGRVVTFAGHQPLGRDAIEVDVVDADGSRRTQSVKWSELTPARVAESLVLPRLEWLSTPTVAALARIFVETGEPRAAAACAECAAARDPAVRADDRVVAEICALDELAKICGRVVPDDVRASPELDAWSARRRFTDVAHAVGGLGSRDVGSFEDDAVDAYLAGGVLWAPEQWDLVRDRLLHARRADREGLHGFEVESDHFTIFTDVSAAFAAQASLVLDAAYEEVALALDVAPAKRQTVVVFARHEDYVARVHDRSGGCWRSSDRTIRTYLHDPACARFADFYYPLLVHEAAHAALGTGLSDWPGCWMHEGIASYFERWNPSRSVRANEASTGTTLLRGRRVRQSLDAGDFPDLASLLALRREWDVDDFGPRTLLRYAAAESLFVHLMTDPRRRAIVSRFIAEANAGRDPADCLSAAEAGALQQSWGAFVRQASR